ncbi:MAG: hypothetical protein AAGK47_05690, partial [Bacteroidota bacterium]
LTMNSLRNAAPMRCIDYVFCLLTPQYNDPKTIQLIIGSLLSQTQTNGVLDFYENPRPRLLHPVVVMTWQCNFCIA